MDLYGSVYVHIFDYDYVYIAQLRGRSRCVPLPHSGPQLNHEVPLSCSLNDEDIIVLGGGICGMDLGS